MSSSSPRHGRLGSMAEAFRSGEMETKPSSAGKGARRNPPSFVESPPKPRPPPTSPSNTYASRFNDLDEPVGLSPEWKRKSSRQRRFTESTLPQAHLRDEAARTEGEMYAQGRDEQLEEMKSQVDWLSESVQDFADRKEEEWKKLYDEEGNPLPQFDENGNPIPFSDEDGPLLETVREEKPKTIPLDPTQLVIKSGWIMKKGGGTRPFVGRRQWSKRWLILDMTNPRYLWYVPKPPMGRNDPFLERGDYESDAAYADRVRRAWGWVRKHARGRIELLYATLNVPSETRLHKNRLLPAQYEFDVVCGQQDDPEAIERVYSICALTEEEFHLWVRTIRYITSILTEFRTRRKAGTLRLPRLYVNEEERDAALLCYAHGKGLFEAVAGQRSEFVIQATSANLKFSAVLESRDLHYDLQVVDQGDGSYVASYVPTRVGTYELSVLLKDYDIQGSPFSPVVKPAPVSAPHCVAEGAGLFCAVGGAINSFTIHCRNAFGNPVVANRVPFEVYARPPIVLLPWEDEDDGGGVDGPTAFTHDNGDGTYAVRYVVEMSPDDRARVERGELLEASIDVLLNDMLNAPSFSRNIKGAPFRPILAASASAQSLAAAARHATAHLGSTAQLSSLLAQMASSTTAGTTSTTHVPGYATRPVSATSTMTTSPPQRIPPPPVDPLVYQGSGPSSYLPTARPVPSSTSSTRQPREASGATDVALTPEQRASIDTEREQLLRLRRELQESKSLVDEQMGRMAEMDRSRDSASSIWGTGRGGGTGSPPPSSSASRRRSSAIPKGHEDDLYWSSPWRAPLPPRKSPATAPHTPVGPIESSAFDSSVVALFNKHGAALRRVFRHYCSTMGGSPLSTSGNSPGSRAAATWGGGEGEGVRLPDFVRCATDFDITPTFASRKELREAFERVARGAMVLDFHAFVEALAYVAVDALGKPMFAHLYTTPQSRVSVLLVMWGLGDPTKLDEVRARLGVGRA